MTYYAQTNIQLYNQLRDQGYSKQEINAVHQGNELANQLFGCLFKPSGKTFIAHHVCTASILGSIQAPANVVVAGLLHGAYFRGDFGDVKGGTSIRNRERVRCVIGQEAEEYIARYTTFPWNTKTRLALKNNLASLDQIDRTVVLMRLANDLEDHLAYGILYCSNAIKRRNLMQQEGEVKIGLAERLGFPLLGAELRRMYQETTKTKILEVFHSRSGHENVYPIIPRSFRRRFRKRMYQTVSSAVHRFRLALRRRGRLVFYR